ncbi:hypothetical protein Q3G72_027828 [Acer saccharum]|nr:hypothetical protein Q3G72_027828 [Acer saccharum]
MSYCLGLGTIKYSASIAFKVKSKVCWECQRWAREGFGTYSAWLFYWVRKGGGNGRERGLSVIDGNQKTTENEDIFQFSSQRSKKQVLGKIFGDSKGIGDCKDGFDSGNSGPGSRRTTELCVVENRKPKCQDGLLLSEKVSGPVLSESLVERLPYKLSHKTSRWKRFDHKQMAISTSYERGIELGKRGLVSNDIDRKNSKKKPKRTHQRPSDGLIEVEVVGNYNSI